VFIGNHMRIPPAQHVTPNCLPRASSAIIKKLGWLGISLIKDRTEGFYGILYSIEDHPSRSRFRRSIATITTAIGNVDHFAGTVVVRPGYAASYCVFCAGRLTQTVRCSVRTVKVPFSCKLGRRRHLYVVIFPPSVLRPSRTQCSYKLLTYPRLTTTRSRALCANVIAP
jgi:hypothetical protein